MHIETVTIQKITRLSQDSVRDMHFLNMHFTLPDGTPKEWTVPGWPGVHEGMTVTAILKKGRRARAGMDAGSSPA